MIVRCPECSTGFKLPDDKITSKGVKLRCSKCSHVFRIRATDSGDTEIFYTDAEDGPPQKHANDDAPQNDEDSQADVGNTTQFGMPNVNKTGPQDVVEDESGDDEPDIGEDADEQEVVDDSSGSRSAQPDYNPFPHAGDTIKPNRESRFESSSADLQEDGADEADSDEHDSGDEGDLDLFDEEDDAAEPEEDPFEGAFDDDDIPDAGVVKTMQAAGPSAHSSDDKDDEPPEARGEISDVSEAAQKQESATPEIDEVPTDDDSAFWSQQQESGFGSAEDMVDPSFGEDGAYFDADQGKVDEPTPSDQTAQADGEPSSGAAGRKRAAREPAATSGDGAARTRNAGLQQSESQSPSTGSANKKTSWEVEQPIEPHTVGGSGMQKFANFLLILFIVVGLFFTVVAVLAGGFIDFKRLPHTLRVAFQGADFQPRAAWIPERAPVKKAPVEDPVRLEGVVGNVIGEGEGQMLAIRGRVRNVDETAYEGVRVRAMLQDANGRVVTEQEANIGKRLNLEDVMAAENPKALEQMMPTESPAVESESTQPFTIVFPSIPARLRKSADLRYKVEMAAGDPRGTSEDTE